MLDQQITGVIRGQGRERTIGELHRGVLPVPIRAVGYAADLDRSHQERERPDTHDDAHDTEHERFEDCLLPHGGALPLGGHERLFGDEDQAGPKHGSSLSAWHDDPFRRYSRSG